MRKGKGSVYALTLAIVLLFAASLLVPWMRGESPIDFGLDLSGGVVVTYRPDFSSRLSTYEGATEDEILAIAKETLASRLYRKLNSIPEVVVRGDQRIVVSIPTAEDQERILEIVGETYRLTMRLVLRGDAEGHGGEKIFFYRERRLELGEPAFFGEMLDERSIRVESNGSQSFGAALDAAPKVAFRFQPPHDEAFARFTGENVGREMAILLDDRVEWVGTIESAIEGVGVLAGSYNLDQASEVAMMLKSGTLPLSLEVESMEAVGPTLGQEIKDLGQRALLLSLLFLGGLIAFAYGHRSSLLITGLASLVCLLFLIAGMAAVFELPLDMVGIAGIVLSIGMGMDAFIIAFESLEARSGTLTPERLKAHRERIAQGLYSFRSEGRTLFHANATTLVVILLLLTTERLRSFALFIFVGIFASVLTIFFTRALLRRTYGRVADVGFDVLSRLRKARPRAYRFRKLYLAVLLAAALATGCALMSGRGEISFGADFKEGTQLIVSADHEEDVDSALRGLEETYPQIPVRQQRMGEAGAGRYLLTLGAAVDTRTGDRGPGEATVDADEIAGVLATSSVDLESLSSIDSRVSSGRLLGSLRIFILSFFFLAVYFVALQEPIERFFSPAAGREGWRASSRLLVFLGVFLAVVADVAVVVMALVLFRIPVSLPVVAAVLTIIGYSVNDSVVLWSHVRNPDDSERERLSATERVTRSVDRILSRACLTSLSTMVPALVILAVGLGPLADFARVMIVGTVAGTLSSMFIVGGFTARALEREGAPYSSSLVAARVGTEGRAGSAGTMLGSSSP